MSEKKKRVLFLCIHNSARSQMAEGLLRHVAGERYDVYSAGIEAGSLRPEAIEVMREIGVDIADQQSKKVDVFAGQPFDLVITTCDEAKEACPLFPGAKRMLHWSFPDPAAVSEADDRFRAFRDVRDGLRAQITALVARSEVA